MDFKYIYLAAATIAISTLGPGSHKTTFGAAVFTSYYVSLDLQAELAYMNPSYSGTSIPPNPIVVESPLGNYYSSVQVDFNASGDDATISNGFSMNRSGVNGDWARGNSQIYFTVSTDTAYSVEGYINQNGGSSEAYIELGSHLYDFTVPQWLFTSSNYSFISPTEITTVTLGSQTGTLLAGHNYGWFTSEITDTNYYDDDGGEASGNITMTLGAGVTSSGSSVPEPASLAMWGLGAIGMAFARCRRNRRNSSIAT